MANHLTDFVVRYKGQIMAGAAVVVLAVYFLPIGDIIFGSAVAAKGGQPPTNENAYKVCEKKIDKGQEVPPPKKCYGFTTG